MDTHLHSFETSFYVFSGDPVLYLDERGIKLEPDACGVIPVGVPHAWRSDEQRTLDRDGVAAASRPGQPPDTFFLGPAPDDEPEALDLRDPRNRNLFHLSAETWTSIPWARARG